MPVRIVTDTFRPVGQRRETVTILTATLDRTACATSAVFRRVSGTPSKEDTDERTDSTVTSLPS